jgi:hypothetical protein
VSGSAAIGAPAPRPTVAAPAAARPLTFKRVLAMLVLPASLLPVVLLGPGMLRAPRKLTREALAGVQRLERRLEPAHHRPPPVRAPLARTSLGNVYGHWHSFPQIGREGLVRLGPTP